MLQDRFLFSLTYIGDLIQQMHELQVNLGADGLYIVGSCVHETRKTTYKLLYIHGRIN